MALSPEEEQLLMQLEADGVGDLPATQDRGGLTPEEAKLLDELSEGDEPEREPTLGDKVVNIARGFGQQFFDTIETPYNLEQIADTATGGLPLGGASERPISQAVVDTIGGEGTYQGIKDVLAYDDPNIPADDWSQYGRTAAEWLGPGAVTKGAQEGLTRALLREPDVAMPIAATTGDVVATETGMDDEGGELAGLAGLFFGKTGGATAAGQKVSKPDQRAVQYILENAENPERALKNLEEALARGEIGTLADLTGDRGISRLEFGARLDAGTAEQLDTRNIARESQIREDVQRPFGEGDATGAGEAVVPRLDKARQRVTEGAEAATQRITDREIDLTIDEANKVHSTRRVADDLDNAADNLENLANVRETEYLEGTPRPAEASKQFSKRLDAARAEAKATADARWNEFKAGDAVDITDTRKSAAKFIDSLDPTEAQFLIREHGDLLKVMGKWKDGTATPAEVQLWLGKAKQRLTAAHRSEKGYGPEEVWLQKIVDIVEESDLGPEFIAAKAATKDQKSRFGDELGAQQRRSNLENLVTTSKLDGSQGATLARLVENANDPNLTEQLAVALRAKLDAKGGQVTQQFLKDHDEVLSVLPQSTRDAFFQLEEVRTTATEARAAADEGAAALDKARKQADARVGRLQRAADQQRQQVSEGAKNLQKSIDTDDLARFADKPNETVSAILKDEKGAERLARLHRKMNTSGRGEDFKAVVHQQLMELISNGDDFSAQALNKLNKMGRTLTESGVITQAEFDDITAAVERSRKVGKRAERIGVALDEFNTAQKQAQKLAAGGASALALQALAGNGSLILGGIVFRTMNMVIEKIGKTSKKTKALKAVEDFLVSPEKFTEAASGMDDPQQAAEAILSRLFGDSVPADQLSAYMTAAGQTAAQPQEEQ